MVNTANVRGGDIIDLAYSIIYRGCLRSIGGLTCTGKRVGFVCCSSPWAQGSGYAPFYSTFIHPLKLVWNMVWLRKKGPVFLVVKLVPSVVGDGKVPAWSADITFTTIVNTQRNYL